nr:DHA2 family efflux MFS transporter permease subunit [Acidomonas methanolica]
MAGRSHGRSAATRFPAFRDRNRLAQLPLAQLRWRAAAALFYVDAMTSPADPPAVLNRDILRIASVVVLGSIMSILDTTIVNVAIRTLSRDFNASLETTQWVATGYMLALAAIIPLTGWAVDRFGTRRLYMLSILLFLVGSTLSGAAWSIGSLILFRILQGLGGGMIMPAGMIILTHAAGPGGTGRIMSLIGVPMLLGPIAGPILGGWFVDDFSWRWIFFVNLPIGALALVAAHRYLARETPRPHHRLDWIGLLLLSPGLALLVFGLAEIAAAAGLGNVGGDICLLAGAALIAAFTFHSALTPGALIDVRLFARTAPAAGVMTSFFFATGFFGIALLMPLYFQILRGEPALGAGLHLAPQGLGAMCAMPLAGWLTDRIGPRRVVLGGLAFVIAGLLALCFIAADTPLIRVEAALFFNGLGMGCVMMPSMSAVLGHMEHHQIARATSALNVIQRVGGSIGTALLTVILAQGIARYTGDAHALHHAVPAALRPAMSNAFAHTFRYALGIILLALLAALGLPDTRPATEAAKDDAVAEVL